MNSSVAIGPGATALTVMPSRGELERPGAGQPHQAGLGGRVAAASQLAQGGVAGDVDDATPALGAHACDAGLGHRHGRLDVDVELVLQGLRRDLVQPLDLRDAEIVDQRVDRPLRRDRGQDPGQGCSVGEIDRMELSGKGRCRRIAGDPDHPIAARREQLSRGEADSAAGPGDEHRTRRHRRYTVATGVVGEPTAPGNRSGGAVSRNRLRPAARSQSARSFKYQSSPRWMPSLNRHSSCNGRNGCRPSLRLAGVGFDGVVVGDQCHQPGFVHPALQTAIAAVEDGTGGIQHSLVGLATHAQQHIGKAGVQADHVAALHRHALRIAGLGQIVIAHQTPFRPEGRVQVDHHGTALDAGRGHVLDAQAPGPDRPRLRCRIRMGVAGR